MWGTLITALVQQIEANPDEFLKLAASIVALLQAHPEAVSALIAWLKSQQHQEA